MASAIVNGIIGSFLTLWLGARYCGLSQEQALKMILSSNISGAFTLFLTLTCERTTWIKDRILTNSIKTWVLFAFAYFLPLFWLEPGLREGGTFIVLVIPLILTTGFMIVGYGPIQDFLTRRAQNRARQKLDRLTRSE